MKKNIFLLLLSFLYWHLDTVAQEKSHNRLEITPYQTTSLIFPYAIKSVDRGSRDILAQVPLQVGNVLHVKAARENIGNTNLTVITSDGKLYSFFVIYAANPATTLIRMDNYLANGTSVHFTGSRLNEAQLFNISRQLENDNRFYYGIKDKAGSFKATLEGIYNRGGTLFYRLVLKNNSPLSYEFDFIRFALKDKQQVKRTATQEEEILPLYILDCEQKLVEPGDRKVLIIALEKFTLTPGKQQVIELFERNGARHLKLRVHSRDILQACPLLFE